MLRYILLSVYCSAVHDSILSIAIHLLRRGPMASRYPTHTIAIPTVKVKTDHNKNVLRESLRFELHHGGRRECSID